MFIFFLLFFSTLSLYFAFKLHDKFDPARYFLLLWGGQILLVFLVFQNVFTFTGYGLAYISIACITFSIGTMTGHFLGNHIQTKESEHLFNSGRALFFLQACLILGILNVLQGIYGNGFTVKDLFSFNILLQLNAAASDSRYLSNTQAGLASQITLIFVYLSPLYGGYLLPLLKNKHRIWSYISVLPAILISITQAVKLGFISSIALWVTGIIVSSYANNKSYFRIRLSAVLKIVALLTFFFSIIYLSMAFRTGKFDWETIKYINDIFVSYAFGHIPAFDLWFTQNTGNIANTGELKTFYGITNFLGLAERKQGVFNEFVLFGKNNFREIPAEMETNIYTMFRFILEDFGFLGSILMIFISGIVSGYSWLHVKRQKHNLFFQVVLLAMLFFIFMSFATSVWVYTSYIAAILMIYFLLIFSFSKQPTEIKVC